MIPDATLFRNLKFWDGTLAFFRGGHGCNPRFLPRLVLEGCVSSLMNSSGYEARRLQPGGSRVPLFSLLLARLYCSVYTLCRSCSTSLLSKIAYFGLIRGGAIRPSCKVSRFCTSYVVDGGQQSHRRLGDSASRGARAEAERAF